MQASNVSHHGFEGLRPTDATVRPARRCVRRGSTLLELLVTMGIIGVLMALLFPMIASAHTASRSVQCLSNLRNIAMGFHFYAAENAGHLPDPEQTQTAWEVTLSRYLPANLYNCPADTVQFPSVGSSYDWRDTGDPSTTLAGKRMSDARRQDCIMAFDVMSGWHHHEKINVVRVDSSAVEEDQLTWLQDLARPIDR